MRTWTTIIALSVVFVFAMEFRPVDYFMTSYLTSQEMKITDTQVLKLTNIV